MEEGLVLQERNPQFAIDFIDIVAASCGLCRNVCTKASGNDRIGIEAGALDPMLIADREADRPRRQIDNVSAKVRGVVIEMLLALVAFGERNECQHRGSDRTRSAEKVQRDQPSTALALAGLQISSLGSPARRGRH